MTEQSSSLGGISFTHLLTLLFIGLKLTGYIDWSWWWVFAPLWAPVALLILIIVLLIVTELRRKDSA